MKKILNVLILSLAIVCFTANAHHAASDIVDDETYAMIEELVADTPHADMTLEDLGMGMTEITIVTETYSALINLMDGGLLEIVGMMVGNVTTTIVKNTGDSSWTVVISIQGYNIDEGWGDGRNRNSQG